MGIPGFGGAGGGGGGGFMSNLSPINLMTGTSKLAAASAQHCRTEWAMHAADSVHSCNQFLLDSVCPVLPTTLPTTWQCRRLTACHCLLNISG